MTFVFKKKYLFVTGLFLFLLPLFVFAQNVGGSVPQTDIDLPNPLGTDSITGLINSIFQVLAYRIAPPVAVFMVVWGAFIFLTAGGSEDRVRLGKKVILYTLIGFAVILLASTLVDVVAEILGVDNSIRGGI